jgi:hypothetical protein
MTYSRNIEEIDWSANRTDKGRPLASSDVCVHNSHRGCPILARSFRKGGIRQCQYSDFDPLG